MSAEAFDTVLSADLTTAPDGRGVLVAEAFTRHPRLSDRRLNSGDLTWAACRLNAEMVLRVAADAVAHQPMTGISGDHADKRALVAALLEATGDLIRDLALDHAHDGELTETAWQQRVDALAALLAGGQYPPAGLDTRAGRLHVEHG